MRLVPLFLLLSVQRMRLEACFFVKTIKRMPDCFYRLPQIFINIHTRKFITKRRTLMKDKIFGVLQRVGRSFMLPIAILPVAGLLLGFGGSFTNETMLETYGLLNVMGPGTIPYAIFQVMSEAGNIVFANLPIIFAMGVAIGMAKKEKEVAALSAAIAFFIMHASISAMITINGGTENMLEGATTSVVASHLFRWVYSAVSSSDSVFLRCTTVSTKSNCHRYYRSSVEQDSYQLSLRLYIPALVS